MECWGAVEAPAAALRCRERERERRAGASWVVGVEGRLSLGPVEKGPWVGMGGMVGYIGRLDIKVVAVKGLEAVARKLEE